ncbi:MAG: hypothetical protein WCL54_08360 [Clostridia bacterium]
MNDLILKGMIKAKAFLKKEDGWGIAEILALIVGIVVVVVIMAPAIKSFSNVILTAMTDWWGNVQIDLFGG